MKMKSRTITVFLLIAGIVCGGYALYLIIFKSKNDYGTVTETNPETLGNSIEETSSAGIEEAGTLINQKEN